ncbi:unnamed protein product [Bodo saltans]|uniref:Leucine-rich repeat protein n=1 Tax=Bodo saltans TaxID=75058 RepID=A0A0S4JXZ0_BODSA|nr:unnamed protein product [Bodo saltans]|eukprot:CUG94013.1 unnamed protein product [Bodo saltans]
MIFEPTGDLLKDYSAFCEIDQLNERDDVLDGIIAEDGKTTVTMRNIEYCLNKRDAAPLCSGIPHCLTLTTVEMTGCGLTEHSLKLVAEALYKSQTVSTFTADFNAVGILKDPTAAKKDKNEISVLPSQFKGAHLRNLAVVDKAEDLKKKDGKGKAPVAAVKEILEVNEKPIALPSGWSSLLLTGLQVLSLRGNAIDDVQAESIAQVLVGNTELISLNLWGNHITNGGAAALASALHSNRRLTSLDLGHNDIDDEGVLALVRCVLTQDLPNDDALKLRQKVCGWTSELPVYPTYSDLVAALAQPSDDKKDPKKKDAPKKKAGDGPIERLKGEFDKDCVRLDENRVRVPGNTSIWCLNFSQNTKISSRIVGCIEDILKRREPTLDEIFNGGAIKEPSSYVVGVHLRHVIIEHTKMDRKYQEALSNILQQS